MVTFGDFDIVEGEDIIHWYNGNYNEYGATLSNSCMRYDECGEYLRVYADTCKMLVLFNKERDLICGRALL